MDWRIRSAVLLAELAAGFVFGRIGIPFFRRIKTGKAELYIGDRFKKDGSEPRFGGAVMLLTALIGLLIGCISAFGRDGSDLVYAMLCAVFFIFLTAEGIFEDWQKDTGRGIGAKRSYIFIFRLTLCAGFLILLKLFGFECADVLLPFRLGYIHLGAAYIPLTALFMTLIISVTENHDCQRGVTDTGVDGLCVLTVMLAGLGFASALSAAGVSAGGKELASLIGLCTAGSCSALLFWCISPSKIYPGQSGSSLMGGFVCCMTIFSGLHIAAVLAFLPAFIDGACSLLQRLVYKKSKKLLFKGASLHGHLKKIGWGDYKIMCVSAAVQIIGCAGAAAFAVYESRIII